MLPYRDCSGAEEYGLERQRFEEDLEEFKTKIGLIARSFGTDREDAISNAEATQESANDTMRKLEMEKKKLPDHARGPMENDFRECRKVFMDLKSDLSNQKAGLQRSGQATQGEGREQYLRMQEAQERTNGRLKSIQQTAADTEAVGSSTLGLLVGQRETLEHTADTLHNSERYVDNSTGTLRGMARRAQTNKVITSAIIAVLVVLIIIVVVSKFR